MDRVFSTRLSEAAVSRIGDLARQLRTSKKKVIEKAIALLAAQIQCEPDQDVFEMTSGAWRRRESASDLVETARTAFRESMARHQG